MMDWLTPNDYAELWHVTPGVVTRHCREGNITAKQIGRNWYIKPGQDMPHSKRVYVDEMTPKQIEARRRKQNKRNREQYEWYKAQGICPSCKTRYADPGHVNCEECNAKRRKRFWDNTTPKTNAERCKERREALKARGMCISCGKAKAVEGHVLCMICARKFAEGQQARKIKRRLQKEAANGNGTNH